MTDTFRVDARNVTDGPKMFNSIPPVAIPAGQSLQDLEITAAELNSMKRFGLFEITGGPSEGEDKPAPPALTGKTKDQLLAIAADEGVTIPDGATIPVITDAITAKRNA